jgi:hypothetical protein
MYVVWDACVIVQTIKHLISGFAYRDCTALGHGLSMLQTTNDGQIILNVDKLKIKMLENDNM